MNAKQRSIVVGTILGDGYLQPTGKSKARLRIEHSSKQDFYVQWKHKQLKSLMQSEPKILSRYNQYYEKTYNYSRCQSLAQTELGCLRREFYTQKGDKQIPCSIKNLLTPLALAVWYMDDGYLYHRDKTAYIYLSNLSEASVKRITRVLAERYDLHPHLYRKKLGDCFYFPVAETRKLLKIVQPYALKQFDYKFLA